MVRKKPGRRFLVPAYQSPRQTAAASELQGLQHITSAADRSNTLRGRAIGTFGPGKPAPRWVGCCAVQHPSPLQTPSQGLDVCRVRVCRRGRGYVWTCGRVDGPPCHPQNLYTRLNNFHSFLLVRGYSLSSSQTRNDLDPASTRPHVHTYLWRLTSGSPTSLCRQAALVPRAIRRSPRPPRPARRALPRRTPGVGATPGAGGPTTCPAGSPPCPARS